MNARRDHPGNGTGVACSGSASLDIRHLLIGEPGPHPLRANGIYHVASTIANEQYAAGEAARLVLVCDAKTVNPDECGDPRLQIVPIDGPKVRGKRVGFSRSVLETLTDGAGEHTIVHIHSARQPLLVSLAFALRKRKIPYAITVHGRYNHVFDEHMKVQRRITALYLKTVERWILQGGRFVQATSPQELAIVREVSPNARIELIPNTAFSSRLSGATCTSSDRSPSSEYPRFGYLGRYELEHKGLDLLVDGFAGYRRAGGKGTLELVGSGPVRAELEARRAELSLQDCVRISGPRFGSAKLQTLASWDYFVMPSRFEGLPTAALEAAAHGLPLIITSQTGLTDAVGTAGAGIAIKALTPEAVTEALLKAEQVPVSEWRVMSKSAPNMVQSIGDWTKIASRMLSLYRKQ